MTDETTKQPWPGPGDIVPRGAFGLRLGIAALHRFRSNAGFIAALQRDNVASRATYYNHLSGKTKAVAAVVARYETLLSVPPGWLADQSEPLQTLDDAYAAISKGNMDNPALRRVLESLETSVAQAVKRETINHPAQQFVPDSGKSSQIRHIPFLDGDGIEVWLAGKEGARDMITIPEWLQVGEKAFAHRIGESDSSMVGGERSYAPGTVLIVDPGRPINPGDRILCRLRDDDGDWMVRRYQASWPLAKAKSFTLLANNPDFAPIHVEHPKKWLIAGRIAFSLQPE